MDGKCEPALRSTTHMTPIGTCSKLRPVQTTVLPPVIATKLGALQTRGNRPLLMRPFGSESTSGPPIHPASPPRPPHPPRVDLVLRRRLLLALLPPIPLPDCFQLYRSARVLRRRPPPPSRLLPGFVPRTDGQTRGRRRGLAVEWVTLLTASSGANKEKRRNSEATISSGVSQLSISPGKREAPITAYESQAGMDADSDVGADEGVGATDGDSNADPAQDPPMEELDPHDEDEDQALINIRSDSLTHRFVCHSKRSRTRTQPTQRPRSRRLSARARKSDSDSDD